MPPIVTKLWMIAISRALDGGSVLSSFTQASEGPYLGIPVPGLHIEDVSHDPRFLFEPCFYLMNSSDRGKFRNARDKDLLT